MKILPNLGTLSRQHVAEIALKKETNWIKFTRRLVYRIFKNYLFRMEFSNFLFTYTYHLDNLLPRFFSFFRIWNYT